MRVLSALFCVFHMMGLVVHAAEPSHEGRREIKNRLAGCFEAVERSAARQGTPVEIFTRLKEILKAPREEQFLHLYEVAEAAFKSMKQHAHGKQLVIEFLDALYELRRVKLAQELTLNQQDPKAHESIRSFANLVEFVIQQIESAFRSPGQVWPEVDQWGAESKVREFYRVFQKLHDGFFTPSQSFPDAKNALVTLNSPRKPPTPEEIDRDYAEAQAYFERKIQATERSYLLFLMADNPRQQFQAAYLTRLMMEDLRLDLKDLRVRISDAKRFEMSASKIRHLEMLADEIESVLNDEMGEMEIFGDEELSIPKFKERFPVLAIAKSQGRPLFEWPQEKVKWLSRKEGPEFFEAWKERLPYNAPTEPYIFPVFIQQAWTAFWGAVNIDRTESNRARGSAYFLHKVEGLEAIVNNSYKELTYKDPLPERRFALIRRLRRMEGFLKTFETWLQVIPSNEGEESPLPEPLASNFEKAKQKVDAILFRLKETKLYENASTLQAFMTREAQIVQMERAGYDVRELPNEYLELLGRISDPSRFFRELKHYLGVVEP